MSSTTKSCDDPDYQCRGCKVEASKHCDECGGYGSGDEEEEDDECEVCDTKTKTTIKTYGCMDMIVCKNCEEAEEKEFYEVSYAEHPDVDYFNTLEEAKAFCDKRDDLDYGLIMLCDKHKKRIGNWGDYDEEDDDVCGQTGRYFDSRNPLNGCGKKIREDDGDENIMIGNISFCIECAESSEGEKAMKYYEEEYEEEEEEEEVDKKKPVLRIVE